MPKAKYLNELVGITGHPIPKGRSYWVAVRGEVHVSFHCWRQALHLDYVTLVFITCEFTTLTSRQCEKTALL